jgi:glycosyltransferase involved in cell wall biosynthesis
MIPELLYHSDFHVLSSYTEAFPLVLQEASFMKKPIIGATDTGAEAIIQDGKSGYLFKNNDVDDLTQKMMLLINNKEHRILMGNKAFEVIINNFSNESKYRHTIQYYKKIMQ